MRPHPEAARHDADPIRGLFSSPALYATLALFFDYPVDPLFPRLIARATGTDIKGVVRQLRKLEGLGIVCSRGWGREKHYRLNEGFELFEELSAVFEKSRIYRGCAPHGRAGC
jgi:hypothetical protein